MSVWPNNPLLYEINTAIWLGELGQAAGRPITLGGVAQAELERLAALGFDALWLMGVWRRSPRGRQIALEHPGRQAEYRRGLPDCAADDVFGSPYAVYAYEVDSAFGGDEELAALRERLRRLGLKLILDFVPNHLAADHGWLRQHPEYFVPGDEESLRREPGNYFAGASGGGQRVFTHGRDPSFSGWTDTVQLDYRRPQTRRAMTDLLSSLAERCDGVRCDMAMLVRREVFLRTWGGEFDPPGAEFWPAAIAEVKSAHSQFLFLAEVYWDMEWTLQQFGFDYTYDKRLYDRLLGGEATAVREYLYADMEYQRHLARFIENHDERRAMTAFGPGRAQAVATLTLTLPGLRLVHEGQIEGRRIKLPVQLRRRPPEPPQPELESFYRRLLAALSQPVFHAGQWRLLEPRQAWAGNPSHHDFVGHCWVLDDEFRLVVVNLSANPAQCALPLGLPAPAGGRWRLRDLLGEAQYVREGSELVSRGLYLDLPGDGYHLFELKPAGL